MRPSPAPPNDLLSHLLCAPPELVAPDLSGFWRASEAVRDRFAHPLERSLALGLVAPSVGAAFVGGYRAALHRLVPSLGAHTRAALCATEDGGAHPRAITTALTPVATGFSLTGTKRFVSCAEDADTLLVLATDGMRADGRPSLALVSVAADAPGVERAGMPPLPFVPEVSHASVRFDAVALAADARLPGDGWSDFVKPFRTVEDLHVQGAVTGYLLGVLRRAEGPASSIEGLAAHALSLRALADRSPDDPCGHLALAGAFATLEALVLALDPWWSSVDPAVASAWARDRSLLRVASRAREQRRAKALGDARSRVIRRASGARASVVPRRHYHHRPDAARCTPFPVVPRAHALARRLRDVAAACSLFAGDRNDADRTGP